MQLAPGDYLDLLIAEIPPKPELGDLAFPMFPLARVLKRAPNVIADEVAALFENQGTKPAGEISAHSGYLNIRFHRPAVSEAVLSAVEERGARFGESKSLEGKRITCEFSSPNTNKPLHLGHLRNDSMGESVSRILKANGAEVLKFNLINDRGIHICKSMLAYQRFGDGRTPEEENLKPDHFVGKYYVEYDRWSKEDGNTEELARKMLRDWERGDPETTELWKRMNEWAISGMEETYRRTGIDFDVVQFESENYRLGREEVLKGLERGVFYRKEDGSIWVDLSQHDLDHKVLLRGDGTSLYLTQDIGTAIKRHAQFPYDRHIYVVASEQKYHFQVLIIVLKLLGYEWAENLYHLAYGMVHLPEGKMKSREGTVVDADDLMDTLKSLAASEIRDKGREGELTDVDSTAEAIALGALNYYLLQPSPVKDITFDPSASISFTGNTGPYLQYTGARICSILRKFEQRRGELGGGRFRAELLSVDEEWEIIKLIGSFSERVQLAGAELTPSHIANHLYELAKIFNKYYHDNPVLHNKDRDLIRTRIRIIEAVRQVLQNGMHLLGIPFLQMM
jgi:arginyl-tRNA synthetase